MAADLATLTPEQLIKKNGELDEKRHKAVQDIKSEQLAIQEELGKRSLLKRGESFSDDELKLLAQLRKDHPAEEVTEEDNG